MSTTPVQSATQEKESLPGNEATTGNILHILRRKLCGFCACLFKLSSRKGRLKCCAQTNCVFAASNLGFQVSIVVKTGNKRFGIFERHQTYSNVKPGDNQEMRRQSMFLRAYYEI